MGPALVSSERSLVASESFLLIDEESELAAFSRRRRQRSGRALLLQPIDEQLHLSLQSLAMCEKI